MTEKQQLLQKTVPAQEGKRKSRRDEGTVSSRNCRLCVNADRLRSHIRIFFTHTYHLFVILFAFQFTIKCWMILSQCSATSKYYRQATQHVIACQEINKEHIFCNIKSIHASLLTAHI